MVPNKFGSFSLSGPPYQEIMKEGLQNLIDHCKFTKDNQSILEDCFYQQSDNDVDITPFQDSNGISEVQKYCEVHPEIPIEIKLLYLYITDPTVEANIGPYTFFNFQEFIKTNDHNFNRKRSFIDIAIMYEGMGHVILISYCPQHQMYFAREDGGSNSYESTDNAKKYDPPFVPDPEEDEMLSFKQLVILLTEMAELT